ncbi:DUF222 domain-containing protein, partial [Microbispora sp. KK1-11]|uniref:DUF222 domain-containing protein n=2 Tax=Microbispora sp. KK1-11 TaxID=2053005 RepID=UPI00115AECED
MDLLDSDPDRPRRSNRADDGWWDRLIADSPLWSSEGSLAHDDCPVGDAARDEAATGATGSNAADGQGMSGSAGGAGSNGVRGADAVDGGAADAGTGTGNAGGRGPAAGRDSREKGRSSWVLVGSLRESAQALALAALPDDADICLAEAEELLFARDRITSALADRVGRVHGAGQAKEHGHASTRSWLRAAAGMSVAGAGRLLTLAVELARLPRVREKFAEGGLAAGVVEAICTATARLSDEHAALAEPILLELAGKAGAAEVAKAGRYLRAVLDPDGEDRDEQADYARRFLRVRPTRGGGLEGEFYLPREAAARLRALLDAYAKPRAEGDDRPLRVRNADAFIALLEEKIATELLVLVNAESLPTDPDPTDPSTGHPADGNDTENTGDCAPSDAEATAGAGSQTDAGADAAASAAAESADRATTAPCDEKAGAPGAGERGTHDSGARESGAREQQAGGHQAGGRDTASTASVKGVASAPIQGAGCDPAEQDSAPTVAENGAPGKAEATDPEWTDQAADARFSGGGSKGPHEAPPNTARPDPPPEDPAAHHAHAGHRPAGDRCHGQTTREGHGHEHRGHGEGGCGCDNTARCSCAAPPWPPGAVPGAVPGASPGAVLGTVPGLLLATGQMLPVSSVHRLARTSTLVRLVMDAEGQVLDMGRK